MVKKLQLLCTACEPRYNKKSENTSPVSAGYFRKLYKVTPGITLTHSNSRRFSFDKDSGRMNSPYKKFKRHKPAATINGTLNPTSPSRPPMAGPMIKPK